jgi:hypothetical protein
VHGAPKGRGIVQFPVVILVPSSTENIDAAVTRLMAPFDARSNVPLHKEYVPQGEIDYVLEVFGPQGLKAEDVDAVLHTLEEDSGCPGGIDEGGIYLMTTDNPQGKWDTWHIQSLRDDVQPVPHMSRERAPAAIITPDGIWHDLNEDLPATGDPQVMRWEHAEPLLMRYRDCLAVTVHCHL